MKRPNVVKSCVSCGSVFSVPFIHRKNVSCSRSCATKFGMSKVDRATFGAKISKTRRERFASGDTVIVGHPCGEETKELLRRKALDRGLKTMLGRRHSDSSKDQMSKTRAERQAAGLYGKSKRASAGKRHFEKAGGEVFYRSSWELRLLEMLETDPAVSSFKYEPFTIPYSLREGGREHLRHYIPDCLVTYTDGRRVLIEVKPRCYLNAAINLAKFEAAREHCDALGITFEVWTQDELGMSK